MSLPIRPTISAHTTSAWRYSRIAVALHWALALLIVVLVGLGWFMMSIEDEPGSTRFFDLHKSLGLTLLALVVVRIAWRATHRPESLPHAVPAWRARAAAWLHGGLYLCMVVMPVTGYLGASHQKHGPHFFGLETPAWATPNHDLAEQFFSVHSVTAWVLVGLVALHTLAALKHLVDRDGVFQRMWFRP